ncbi:proline-tRNA ligase [Micractinium conductrix]|uniref:Proline-tRNA ligase n=1 Tax=Micractinium conductrix TaxID=554055 RepID=A0A2P6V7I2_9CHLO|nr:proline-tRNA ligase [Micractinium conductrix]|eukprot:PSC70038.1 proline-tRNA ligase [Micractinium conductrix]
MTSDKAHKKGKKSAEQEAQPAEPAAAAAAADGADAARRNKKRRRPKKGSGDEPALNADEAERCKRQRHLRELALKLRAQGREYKPKRKHKPRRRVQLIIVPIVWQKRASEMKTVMLAVEKVQELLRELGVKCDTDTTTELTPGQKFRAWEEKGVMLRVELGPKEAEAGTAILARCRTAGEVADKKTVEIGPRLCQLVKQHLEEMGQVLTPPDAAGGGAGGAAEAQDAQQGAAAAAAEAGGSEEQEVQAAETANGGVASEEATTPAAAAQQPEQRRAASKRRQHASAEELEGDFAGVPLLQEPSTRKKGQKKAAAAATQDAEVAAFQALAGEEGAEGGRSGKKKKKAAHVVF